MCEIKPFKRKYLIRNYIPKDDPDCHLYSDITKLHALLLRVVRFQCAVANAYFLTKQQQLKMLSGNRCFYFCTRCLELTKEQEERQCVLHEDRPCPLPQSCYALASGFSCKSWSRLNENFKANMTGLANKNQDRGINTFQKQILPAH